MAKIEFTPHTDAVFPSQDAPGEVDAAFGDCQPAVGIKVALKQEIAELACQLGAKPGCVRVLITYAANGHLCARLMVSESRHYAAPETIDTEARAQNADDGEVAVLERLREILSARATDSKSKRRPAQVSA